MACTGICANGTPYDFLLLGGAGWMRYISGVDEQGQAIEIRDPLKDQLASIVANSEDGAQRVEALLRLQAVFGDDLHYHGAFVSRVTELYQQLRTQSARHGLRPCHRRLRGTHKCVAQTQRAD